MTNPHGFRVAKVMHSTPDGEHSPEDCPGGDTWPCGPLPPLPPQPETGSTFARDNDPALVPVSTPVSTRASKASALRQVASHIASTYPIEALLLLEMADDLDPASQPEF